MCPHTAAACAYLSYQSRLRGGLQGSMEHLQQASRRSSPAGVNRTQLTYWRMSANRDGLTMAMKRPFKVSIERELLLENQETGSKNKIRVLIGSPRWTKKGEEARCPVAVEGWLGRVEDMRGDDPMHAMEMALYFMNSLLKDLPPPKRVTWPNGDLYKGTYPDSSGVVSDALFRRQLKLQHEILSKLQRQRRKGKKSGPK